MPKRSSNSSIVLTLNRIRHDYVFHDKSNVNFVVKEGHYLNVTASPSSEEKDTYRLKIESADQIPFHKRGGYQLLLLAIPVCAIIISISLLLLKTHIDTLKFKDRISQLEQRNDSLVSERGGLHQQLSSLVNLNEKKDLADSLTIFLELKNQEISRLRSQLNLSKSSQVRREEIARLEGQVQFLIAERDSIGVKLTLANQKIDQLSTSLKKIDLANKEVENLIKDSFESMDIFYHNDVLKVRNAHHAEKALKGFKKLVDEYSRTEFSVVMSRLKADYEEARESGKSRGGRKSKRKNS